MKPLQDLGEKEFIKNYDPAIYERPNASVDTVIYTVFDRALHVLLVRRAEYPFKNMWSLVGGFIDIHRDSDLESTAKRKLYEKTGINTPYLEQYETIGSKTRDPRYWSITTVYFALLHHSKVSLRIGDDAVDIKWMRITNNSVPEVLAFDHTEILKSCCGRLRNKVLYTSLPLHLVGTTFTLVELQNVYEVLLDETLDAKSFRRRMLSAGVIEETGKMKLGSRRPAKLYRRVAGTNTHFFMRNIEASSY